MIAGKSKKLAVAEELRELTPAELTEVTGGWTPCGPPFPHHHHRHHHHHHHRHHHHRNIWACNPGLPPV